MGKKVSDFFKCILPCIIIFALQAYLTYAGMFVLFCVLAHNYKGGGLLNFMKQYADLSMSTDFLVNVMMVYTVVAVVLFGIWYYLVFLPKQREKKGIAVLTEKPLAFGAGIVLLAFGMQYLCVYGINILTRIFPQWMQTYETMLERMGLSGDTLTVPIVLSTVILAPICEELAFRGITMGYAKRNMTFWFANIIQALLFAGMHMNPMQGVYAFFMGLLLGYLVNKSGSIVMGIILHMAFNTIGVLGNYLIVSGSNPVQLFLILFGTMAATYFGFVLIDKNIPKKVNNDESQSDNYFTA